MKVAHIITRLIVGGAQQNTVHNVDDQHHLHGDEVCLITGPTSGPEGSIEQQARDRGLDVRVLPELTRSVHPLTDARCYFALKRMLRDYRPDVVHTHSSKAGIIGRRAAFTLGIPCVHTIHGASFHYGQPAFLHSMYKFAERRADKWCQHFISVCDAMSRQYLEAGIGTPEKFTTVYSGMDVDQFVQPARDPADIRAELKIAPHDIVVGKVARLFNLKGHEYLIEAAPEIVAAVPNVKFLLAGDGILFDQFVERIAALNLTQHFVFAGLIPPQQIGDYLHAMDVVVHTSVWEGLARVLPQAMIAGKPVISFDIDGAAEVCIHEETGLLVPPRAVDQLAAATTRLCTNRELREQLGANGRERFTDRFRHETMTEKIREVYRSVLQSFAAG